MHRTQNIANINDISQLVVLSLWPKYCYNVAIVRHQSLVRLLLLKGNKLHITFECLLAKTLCLSSLTWPNENDAVICTLQQVKSPKIWFILQNGFIYTCCYLVGEIPWPSCPGQTRPVITLFCHFKTEWWNEFKDTNWERKITPLKSKEGYYILWMQNAYPTTAFTYRNKTFCDCRAGVHVEQGSSAKGTSQKLDNHKTQCSNGGITG